MDAILEIFKYFVPLIIGVITWYGTRNKSKADSEATISNAALAWSIADRAEMEKLRIELYQTRNEFQSTLFELEEIRDLYTEKEKKLVECCEHVEGLQKRLEVMQEKTNKK